MAFKKPSWETNETNDMGLEFKKPSWEIATPKPVETKKPTPPMPELVKPETAKPGALEIIKTSFSRDVDKKKDLIKRMGVSDEQFQDIQTGLYGKKKPVGTGSAFMGGLASGASLSTAGYGPSEFAEKYPEHKVAYTVGHLGGSLLPFGAAYKTAKPVATSILARTAPKALRPFVKAGTVAVPETSRVALTGALASAPIGAVEAAVEGQDTKGIAKNTLLYAGLGAAGDVAVERALIPALKPVVSKIWQKYKGKPVPTETIEREAAKEHWNLDWDNLSDTQKAAIRKAVQDMQPEAVQSGRLLGSAQEFTMRDMTPQDKLLSAMGGKKPLMLPEAAGTPREDLKKSVLSALQNRQKGETVGLRVPTKISEFYSKEQALKRRLPYSEGKTYNIGDILEPSFSWKNEVPTNRRLSGTSVLQVNEKNIDDAIKLLKIYPNADDILVVKGAKIRAGTDKGEVLLRNPQVIDKFPYNILKDGAEKKISTNQGEELKPLLFRTQIPQSALNKTPKPPESLQFKQTIETPKVYDKNAFTGIGKPRTQIRDEIIKLKRGKEGNPLSQLKPPIANQGLPGEPLSMKSQIAFKKGKKSFSETLGELYRATVTNQANLDKFSQGLDVQANLNPAVMATTAGKAGGTAGYIIDDALVDMGGTKIGESLRKTFTVPKGQEEAFQEYLLHRHNVSRMRQGKPIFGEDIKEGESLLAIANFEKGHPEFKEQAANFDKWWKNFGDEWIVKSGLASKDLMEHLGKIYEHYVPTFRETTGRANKRINTFGRISPAKVIQTAEGSDKRLIKPFESIPAQVNKIVKAARQNEIYQGILDAVRKDPEKMKPWAELTKVAKKQERELTNNILNKGIDGIAEQFDGALQGDPIKGYMLTVMENGKPVSLRINEGLYRDLMEFKKLPQSEVEGVFGFARKYFTNPFKSLITGYNPFFALRNIARDVPAAYIQGTENNPFRFIGNLGVATKEAASPALNKGINKLNSKLNLKLPTIKGEKRFNEYKALGGQGSNFFNVEKGLQLKGNLGKVGNAIQWFNNLTETAPRYAEYLGTLKREGNNYAGKMQGIKNAAEVTVDFSRHGNVTKALDAVTPYLNPAVQGIDKFGRTMKDPVNIAKALAVVTTPTAGLYALNQAVAKKEYDQLDNRTKDTYFLIPGGNGKFIKIAKTREAGVLFGALFERLARLTEGQEGGFEGFGNAVANNFFVQNPLTQHIAAPLVWNLPRNKDFANRTIVPQSMLYDKRSPRYQYDERTSEIAKKIGDTFNLSPKQIDYLIKSYLGVIGNIIQPATTKGVNTVEVLSRQFTADPLYSNEILNDFYDKLDELQRKETDSEFARGKSKLTFGEETQRKRLQKARTKISKLQKQKLKAQGMGQMSTVDRLQRQILDTAQKALK